jgi:hypothetical protein
MNKCLLLVGSMFLLGATSVCVGMKQEQSALPSANSDFNQEVFQLSQAELKSEILAKFSIPDDYDWSNTLIGTSNSFRIDEDTKTSFYTKSYWVSHQKTKKVDWFHAKEEKTN